MKSSQINFFLTANDQAELLKKLDPLDSFIYVARSLKDGAASTLESAKIGRMGRDPLTILVTLQEFIKNVSVSETAGSELIDVLTAPVIEFSRCYVNEQYIRRGRFYVIKSYLDYRSIEISKDKKFVEWGESVMSKTRRLLKRDTASLAYLGPEAEQLKETGLKMVSI
jgi:hypothetical protein